MACTFSFHGNDCKGGVHYATNGGHAFICKPVPERRAIHPDGRPAVSVEFSGPTPEGLIQRAGEVDIEACARAAYEAHRSNVADAASQIGKPAFHASARWELARDMERENWRRVARAVLKAPSAAPAKAFTCPGRDCPGCSICDP